jgi:hypothetical protein
VGRGGGAEAGRAGGAGGRVARGRRGGGASLVRRIGRGGGGLPAAGPGEGGGRVVRCSAGGTRGVAAVAPSRSRAARALRRSRLRCASPASGSAGRRLPARRAPGTPPRALSTPAMTSSRLPARGAQRDGRRCVSRLRLPPRSGAGAAPAAAGTAGLRTHAPPDAREAGRREEVRQPARASRRGRYGSGLRSL